MRSELREIRETLGYTVRDFAELLGFGERYYTYHGYETGRRKTPDYVLKEAQAALKRDQQFFQKDLPRRVNEFSKKGVPNEAVRGQW